MLHKQGQPIFRPFATFALLGLAQPGTWLVMLPVYLAWFSPAQFGMLVLALFMASLFGVAANLKLDAAMRTFYFDFAENHDLLRAYLANVIAMSVIFALITYLVVLAIGPAAYQLLFRHEDIRFFPAGAIAIATACINACLAPYLVYLRNAVQLRQLAWLQLSVAGGSVVLQMLLIMVFNLGIVGALLGALVPSALALAIVVASHLSLRSPGWRLVGIGRSLRYSAPLMLFAWFFVLERRLDVVVLEHHLDLDRLGAYAMLVSLLGLLSYALSALDSAIRPQLFAALAEPGDLAKAQVRYFRRLYYGSGLATLAVVVVFGAAIGLLSDDPVYLSIRSWLPAGAVAFVPGIVTRFHALYFEFHKHSVEVTVWIIIRTALMLGLLLMIVPGFGIGGALFAIFVSQLVNAIVFSSTARRKFSV